MITIYKVLEIYGLVPRHIKLVRHGNKDIPIRETFVKNLPKLEAYQSFQTRKKFGEAKSIAVFAPYYRTTAIFLGLWDIHGCKENRKYTQETLSTLQKHSLPETWFSDTVCYDLKGNPVLDDLSERMVIEWGRSALSWVQSKDKEVVEIKAKKSIGDFQSFNQVDLNYRDLQMLMQSPDTNPTWVNALSSVNGVYLIREKVSGKLYVGAAYGNRGIYGRWSDYAKKGDGGNLELRDLDPMNFQFSILEIVSATTTEDEVKECENRWKDKLGTRQFGLNKN